ncbi:putative bifunctional diguanylate cyclase/phosphodiesterase [Alkalilacustris brevis]|uniref:putative bifunctional diguanylate cyclase/phosphodiesterase n=1 Tax=Alkalilacustris brevis TaxID=2026338 RepID=UPI000E0CF0AD|nr:bifunctional diguanylate cyclase/phosphodiesterase [Alkalilacustris brevis]
MSANAPAPRFLIRMLRFARRPELLAFLPAITLAAFWLGGEDALILTALAIPGIYALAGLLAPVLRSDPDRHEARDALTGLFLRKAVIERLDETFALPANDGRKSACITLSIDNAGDVSRHEGTAGFSEMLQVTSTRLATFLRDSDTLARLDNASFAVALAPGYRLDLESTLQLAARLQEVVEAPLSINGNTIHPVASAGFALPDTINSPDGATLLEAAELALDDARRSGPGAIRAYTPAMRKARADLLALRNRFAPALENGELRPFFQPQISTDTGEVTGFETLVRWHHPERGLLTPEQFLPDLLASGLAERLGEVMLSGALRQLAHWEARALHIPGVAVNFAPEELRNPRLPEKVQWELDRYGLAPERLTVEVLETVVAQAGDDMVVQTLRRLGRLGCRIDLDDFGTGQASISNIRRFGVTRIKIDRSFVTRIDEDRDQQRMVAAILSLAERLGLETLAEGVETPQEHAMLAQLGCHSVQGFVIARPMAADAVAGWIRSHRNRLAITDIASHPSGRRLG